MGAKGSLSPHRQILSKSALSIKRGFLSIGFDAKTNPSTRRSKKRSESAACSSAIRTLETCFGGSDRPRADSTATNRNGVIRVMVHMVNPRCHPKSPKKRAPAHHRGKLPTQPLFDHRLPRHQAESLAVVQHRVATTGEHDATAINACNALPISYRPRLQACFGWDILAT